MPASHLRLHSVEDPPNIEDIAVFLTNTMRVTLNKKQDANIISVATDSKWFLSGTSVKDASIFYLEVIVSQGTVSAEQKEMFIRNVFQYFERTLPRLSEKSYVFVNEVPADAFGYGGRTQKSRQIAN